MVMATMILVSGLWFSWMAPWLQWRVEDYEFLSRAAEEVVSGRNDKTQG